MTKRAKKLTTLASVAALITVFAAPATAQSVDSTISVGVSASASTGTGDILSSLLGDLTGLLGGLGIGGLL